MGLKLGARFSRDNERARNVCGVYGRSIRTVMQG